MLLKHFIFAATTGLFILLSSTVKADSVGVVNVNKLNVRVKPTTKYSVTCTLEAGDKVNIIKKENEWYAIKAPKASEVWVSRAFIKDGIIKERVNLRCGPSVAYMKYGIAEAGTKVNVLDSSRSEWVKIEPTENLVAYVSAQCIDIIKKEEKTVIAKTEDSQLDEILKQNKENAKKSEIELPEHTSSIDYIDQTEKTVTVQGVLLPLTKNNSKATHSIAVKVNNQYFPICYIYTGKHKYNLKLWEKNKVSVKGKQSWVKGWQRPIVKVERITPLW